MMRQLRYNCITLLILMIAAATGCRQQEPLPSYPGDVGVDGVVLLPTKSAWVDPAVTDGRADWIDFRKPQFSKVSMNDPTDIAEGETAVGVENSDDIEKELRELLAEYNDLVEQEKYEDILEFYVTDQSEIVEQMVKVIPLVSVKFKELLNVLPEMDEKYKSVFASLTLKEQLKLDVESIKVVNENSATGVLTIPTLSADAPDPMKQILFTYDEEYWYMDVSSIRIMKDILPFLEKSAATFEQMISGIQSGSISNEEVATQLGAVAGMFSHQQHTDDHANSSKDADQDQQNENSGNTDDENDGG